MPTFKEFVFPIIGSDSSYISFLKINLPTKVSAWMGCLLLIVISIAIILYMIFYAEFKANNIISISACIIAVIIQMVYYVNRSAELCLYIVLPIVSILIAWLIEYIQKREVLQLVVFGDGILRAFFSWSVVTLVAISVMFLVRYFPMQMEFKSERDLQDFKEFAEIVKEQIPPNTLGFGEGIDEIYSYLGWDTGYYGIDIPDLMVSNKESQEYIWSLANQADALFVNDDTLNTLSYYMGNNTWKEEVFMQEFTIIADYYYNNINFRYYVRK